MLRKTLIALHLAGAALSVTLLVSTFLAKGIITSKAREVAIEKSRELSDPLALRMEETLDRPVLGKLIRGDARDRMEKALSDYRADPEEWLDRLADGELETSKASDFPELENPLARKAVDAVTQGISNLKLHLDESFSGLLFDLRLFAGTNLIAFLLATGLTWGARSPHARYWLLAYSAIMLLAFAISISIYVDQNWTWNLLRNNHMGWEYSTLLGFITVYLCVRMTPELFLNRPPDPEDSDSP
jgi:hypothetical protein